jgi:glycosyltransferase involved in cell wall biosynthesis
VTWIHIGDGPSRASVERVVSRLSGSVQVELPGLLPNAEVLNTYRERKPSLFVNLSDSEGMPVSIMEAMSAGVPVIATAVGGVPEMVAHRKNGLLLQPDPDPSEVGAAIEHFVDMGEEDYRTCARAAWSSWNAEFNAAVNYPRFVADVFGG